MLFIKLNSKQDHIVVIQVLLQREFIKDLQYAGPCMSGITVGKEIWLFDISIWSLQSEQWQWGTLFSELVYPDIYHSTSVHIHIHSSVIDTV